MHASIRRCMSDVVRSIRRLYIDDVELTGFPDTLADSWCSGVCTLAAVSSALKFAFRRAEDSGDDASY